MHNDWQPSCDWQQCVINVCNQQCCGKKSIWSSCLYQGGHITSLVVVYYGIPLLSGSMVWGIFTQIIYFLLCIEVLLDTFPVMWKRQIDMDSTVGNIPCAVFFQKLHLFLPNIGSHRVSQWSENTRFTWTALGHNAPNAPVTHTWSSWMLNVLRAGHQQAIFTPHFICKGATIISPGGGGGVGVFF